MKSKRWIAYEPYRAPGETGFPRPAGYRATGIEVQGATHFHTDSADSASPYGGWNHLMPAHPLVLYPRHVWGNRRTLSPPLLL